MTVGVFVAVGVWVGVLVGENVAVGGIPPNPNARTFLNATWPTEILKFGTIGVIGLKSTSK